ncbi:opsin-VA-like [Ostrea edulis]|uniref:opsin-VA-like n=1 Tax=Ostrea edulis TaxID=37623 RepID=UPI0024AEB761|nr:opsin-VA-like [Ostrea edulis]
MFNSPTFEHIRGKKIGIFICLTWSYAFLWGFCPLVGWGRYGLEPFGTSCSIDWTDKSENNRSYIMSVFLFILAIPFAMIIIFYAKIFFKIRKTVSAAVDCDPGVPIRDPRHGVKSESRAIQDTILENITRSVVVFLIAWTPYACLAVLLTFRLNVSVYFLLVAALLAKTQCAVNIFVYALGFSDFRKELKRCFRTRIQ